MSGYANINDLNNSIKKNINTLSAEVPKISNALDNGYIGEYLGKNVRSTVTGSVNYISDKGAIKHFATPEDVAATFGRNGCPVDFIEVDEDFGDNSFREKYPYLYDGTDMITTGTGFDKTGQSCGGAGKNVFVDKKSPVITQYRGCLNSNESDLDMVDIGQGNIYTFEQCRDLAGSGDYNSFSLNTSEVLYTADKWVNQNKSEATTLLGELFRTSGTNELNMLEDMLNEYKPYGKCYASTKPIQPGTDIIYASQTPFYVKTVNMPLNTCTKILQGYEDYSKRGWAISNNAILTSNFSGVFTLSADGTLLAQWATSLSDTKCAYGGGVNLKTLTATYGQNCAASSAEGEFPNDAKCTIQQGNYTNNALLNINGTVSTDQTNMWNNLSPSFTIGTKWGNYYGLNDPNNTIVGAEDTCYGCHKNYTISYQCGADSEMKNLSFSGESGGKTVNLDCGDSFFNCFCGIGISDSGNVKILQGFFSSNTTEDQVLNVSSIDETLVPNPGLLQAPEWVERVNQGGQIAQGIQYRGETYNVLLQGAGLDRNQKLISPSGTCYIQISALGYLTINYNIASLTCNNKTGNNTGVNNTSSGLLMWGQPGAAPNQYAVNEIISKTYSQNFGKMGFVDDNLTLHEYPENMMPTFTSEENVAIFGGTQVGSSTNVNIKECQVKCTGNTGCNYFQASGGNCYYYNTIGSTAESYGNVVFTKHEPSVKVDQDKCPFQNAFDTVSASDWEFYVKGESMNPNFSCNTKNPNYLNSQIDNANKLQSETVNELEKQTAYTNDMLKNWGDASTDFTNVVREEKKISSEINMYGRPGYKEGFDTITMNSMVKDSEELQKRNKNRVIFWSFMSITMVIMVLRLIQLYSK